MLIILFHIFSWIVRKKHNGVSFILGIQLCVIIFLSIRLYFLENGPSSF